MGKSKRRDVSVRAEGVRRKEPDVRRLARAIIKLSVDDQELADRLDDLAATEQTVRRRRRSTGDPKSPPGTGAAA